MHGTLSGTVAAWTSALVCLVACAPEREVVGGTSGITGGDVTAGGEAGSGGSSGGGSDGGSGSGDSSGGDGDDGGGDGDGDARFDVGEGGGSGNGAEGGDCDPQVDEGCGCAAVDLLFVIDNSSSMGDYQNALAIAFPQFADTLIEALPPGTSLHVGVTSTEMQRSSLGMTTNCVATGDNGQPQDAFYVTPDVTNNGINGAQGRLYDPGGGQTFFEIDTDASAADVQALKDWFGQAARIGDNGSQIEMSSAGAGWAFDPANSATNGGFARNDGAVLVIFFVQDEGDQTPHTIAGQPGGVAMAQKVLDAKNLCGPQCVLTGGFVNTGCLGRVALGGFLNGFQDPPTVAELPDEDVAENMPQVAADEMNALLRDTLAGVIAKKCDEIPPPIG